MKDGHSWEINLKKPGDHGIRRLNPDGRESIRGLEIPTGSTFARRIGKLIDSKKGPNRKK